MNYKEEIQKILKTLKANGHLRPDIEERLGLAEGSISQTIARNGSERLLKSLQLYLEWAKLSKSGNKVEETIVEEPAAEYDGVYKKLIVQQNKLIDSMNQLSATSNRILSKMADSVETKVDILDLNLTDALARIESLSMNMKSGRHVVLKSLARLEGKPEGQLLAEADSINASLLREQIGKQNKKGDKRS
jgi:hypothetical protein